MTTWAETAREYVLVHHLVNDNSHFHLYLDAPNLMSQQSVRYHLKTKFKLLPTQYSVKQCDATRVNEYIQYLFNTKHGNLARLISTNVDDERITAARTAAAVVSEEYSKQRKNNKPKTLYAIAEEVRATVEDPTDQYKVIHMTIKLLHKYCRCHDRYLVIKVVDTVRAMVDPAEYAQHIFSVMN